MNKYDSLLLKRILIYFVVSMLSIGQALADISVGDFDGDGLVDVAEFATDDRLYIKLSTGEDSFTSATPWQNDEFTKDWTIDKHPRMVADVNGDGKDDVVGFHSNDILVARSKGTGFAREKNWLSGDFGYNSGWMIDRHPRMMADVNGDGMDDVVGFSHDNIFVALSTRSGSARKTEWLRGDFGYNSGWKVDKHPRIMADVNGDGMDDVVGFSNDIIFVALSTGSGFARKTEWLRSRLTYNSGWKTDKHQRIMADVNGDGMDDIVAVGYHRIFVALSTGNGFAVPQRWGWLSQ